MMMGEVGRRKMTMLRGQEGSQRKPRPVYERETYAASSKPD